MWGVCVCLCVCMVKLEASKLAINQYMRLISFEWESLPLVAPLLTDILATIACKVGLALALHVAADAQQATLGILLLAGAGNALSVLSAVVQWGAGFARVARIARRALAHLDVNGTLSAGLANFNGHLKGNIANRTAIGGHLGSGTNQQMLHIGQHTQDVVAGGGRQSTQMRTLPLTILIQSHTVVIQIGLLRRTCPDQTNAIANDHHIAAWLIAAARFRRQGIVEQATIGVQLVALHVAAQTPVLGRVRLVRIGIFVVRYVHLQVVGIHQLALVVGDQGLVANEVNGNQLAVQRCGAAATRLAGAEALLAATDAVRR